MKNAGVMTIKLSALQAAVESEEEEEEESIALKPQKLKFTPLVTAADSLYEQEVGSHRRAPPAPH